MADPKSDAKSIVVDSCNTVLVVAGGGRGTTKADAAPSKWRATTVVFMIWLIDVKARTKLVS